MKKYFYLIYVVLLTAFFYTTSSWNSLYAQGTTCVTSTPFCTNSGLTYPAGLTLGAPPGGGVQAPFGPNYGCLDDTPSPTWLFMRIQNSGTIDLNLVSVPEQDVDYAVWGPFESCTTPSEACEIIFTGALAPSNCSFSGSTTEFPILKNGQTGEIFIMMVTNYSNQPTDLSINKIGGIGSTDCSIVFVDDCPVDFGDDKVVCSTETLPLLEATCPIASPNYRFEWFVDGVSQGTPSAVSTFDPNHAPQLTAVNYRVVVTELSSFCPVGEDEINVTIKPSPKTDLIVFPNDSTLCNTVDAFVRVVESQTDISYQILRNGTPFGGLVAGTGGTIQLPLTGMPIGVSTIQVQARYTVAPTCTVILTEQAEITILGDIQVNLNGDFSVCETSTVTINAFDPSQIPNPTYKWFRSTDGGITYDEILGETNSSFDAIETLPIPQTPFEVTYKVEVNIDGSTCFYEDDLQITFEPLPLTNLIIEVDSVCNTGTGTIRIVNPQMGTRYSYQLRENNAGSMGAPIGAAQSSLMGEPLIFITPPLSATTSYYITVDNTNVISDCDLVLDTEPEIIVHPLPTAEFSGGANLCVGENVELTVTMTGTPPFTLIYQRDSEPEVTVDGINANTYSFITDEAGIYTINTRCFL